MLFDVVTFRRRDGIATAEAIVKFIHNSTSKWLKSVPSMEEGNSRIICARFEFMTRSPDTDSDGRIRGFAATIEATTRTSPK